MIDELRQYLQSKEIYLQDFEIIALYAGVSIYYGHYRLRFRHSPVVLNVTS